MACIATTVVAIAVMSMKLAKFLILGAFTLPTKVIGLTPIDQSSNEVSINSAIGIASETLDASLAQGFSLYKYSDMRTDAIITPKITYSGSDYVPPGIAIQSISSASDVMTSSIDTTATGVKRLKVEAKDLSYKGIYGSGSPTYVNLNNGDIKGKALILGAKLPSYMQGSNMKVKMSWPHINNLDNQGGVDGKLYETVLAQSNNRAAWQQPDIFNSANMLPVANNTPNSYSGDPFLNGATGYVWMQMVCGKLDSSNGITNCDGTAIKNWSRVTSNIGGNTHVHGGEFTFNMSPDASADSAVNDIALLGFVIRGTRLFQGRIPKTAAALANFNDKAITGRYSARVEFTIVKD